MSERYPRVAALKTADAFARHLASSGIDLAFDRELAPGRASPLAAPFTFGDARIGNRFAILPMEGWDGTTDGAAERSHAPALAALRPERRQAHLGRRSGRPCGRRAAPIRIS